MHHVDPGIGEESIQIGGPLLGRAGHVVVAAVDPGGELDAKALRLPPLDSAEEVGAVLPWARGRGDADGSTVREGACEEGRRFQDLNLPSSPRRWPHNRALRVCDPQLTSP
jgi:hypothetical protein